MFVCVGRLWRLVYSTPSCNDKRAANGGNADSALNDNPPGSVWRSTFCGSCPFDFAFRPPRSISRLLLGYAVTSITRVAGTPGNFRGTHSLYEWEIRSDTMTGSQGKQGSKNRGNETNCTQHETTAAAAGAAAPGKADTNTAWDRRIRGASCASFFLGCVWVLLFPLVTLTTGESKPRGTFFDENAMLVHHTSTKLTVADVDWAKPARLAKAYPQQVKRCPARLL